MDCHRAIRKRTLAANRYRRWAGFAFVGRRPWVFLLLTGIVVILLALSVWKGGASSAAVDEAQGTFTVRRDDLTVTVTETGNIKAQETTDIICEVETRGIEVVSIVPEGTVITPEDVENGKVLCELNSAELEDRYNQEQITFSTVKADYAEAQESYVIQQNQNESDIKAAELTVKFALMDFQKYLGKAVAQKVVERLEADPNASMDMEVLLNDPNLGGEASQRLRELNGNITLASENLQKARNDLTWTRELFKKKYVAESELKKDELEVKRLIIEEEKAQIALNLFERYEFPKQVEQLLSNFYEAERALTRTKAQARSKLVQAEAKRASTKASFDLQKRQLSRLEKEIKSCTIRAPSPGIVIYGTSADFRRRREDPIEVGDIVHHGQKIITIPNSNLMGVELSVHESVVDKVRPDMPVTITVESFPDKTFEGKVLKVAPLPDPQHFFLSTGAKVYTAQVSIKGTHDFLKPGMSAKVEVLVEQLDDVVIAPIQAVANRGGRKVCYILGANGREQREVQTGSFNDTFVEIKKGLRSGDQVLLNPPRLAEPTLMAGAERTAQEAQQGKDKTQQEGPDRAQSSQDKQPRRTKELMSRLQNLPKEQRDKLRQRFENMSEEEKQALEAQMRAKLTQQEPAGKQ